MKEWVAKGGQKQQAKKDISRGKKTNDNDLLEEIKQPQKSN